MKWIAKTFFFFLFFLLDCKANNIDDNNSGLRDNHLLFAFPYRIYIKTHTIYIKIFFCCVLLMLRFGSSAQLVSEKLMFSCLNQPNGCYSI